MTTNKFQFLTGELVEIEAQSETEAWQLLESGQYEEIEALTDLRSKPCSCSNPTADGWHVDDNPGITFGGLKRAQNESADEMAQWIAHIYFTKSTETFNELMELIADHANQNKSFSSYSETCEWEA